MISEQLTVRWLGHRKDYQPCWQAMQEFTQNRGEEAGDEIWLLEHAPVFTQGQNGKPEHVLNPGDIPVVQTDRGGQVTYHGPGQLMIYTLIDLRRKKMNIRELVSQLEQTFVDFLAEYNIEAAANPAAPGVYVNGKKIASIGLRVRKGCSYHGVAFNVALDMEPFTRINPCGYSQLQMASLSELGGPKNTLEAGRGLIKHLMKNLRYTSLLDQTHIQ